MKNLIVILLVLMGIAGGTQAQEQIAINPFHVKHGVSPMIQGHGLIYSHEADSIYANGEMADLFEDIGTGFLRWPGGTVVTHYHWNNLNGNGWSDNWDPNYNSANDASPDAYMDLDEYISLCRASNVEPMLGINMSSGMEWERQADGVQEAIDLINYCISEGFDVKYFYLDNETYHSGNLYNKDPDGDNESWTAGSYAAQVNIYAAAIKNLIPDARLIANWSNKIRTDNGFQTLINNAGDNIDYIDVHWYWRWNEASWDLWKSQTPIQFDNQWYNGGTFVEEIAHFNNLVQQLNKPHIKLACLEWNIAPGPWQSDPSHSKFKTALMQSEIQMQMMMGGLEIGSLWSTQWPGTPDASDRFLVDPDDGYAPNPTAKMFELYKNALNGKVVESSASDNKIMVLAVSQTDTTMTVYLLNKKDVNQNVRFTLNGHKVLSVEESIRFTDPGIIQQIGLWQVDGKYHATLKANTLTMITFNIKPENLIQNGGFETGLNHWNTWKSVETATATIYHGDNALKLNGNASAHQWVHVAPSTTYTLSAFAKIDDPSERVVLGITDYLVRDIYDTSYTLQHLTFTTTATADSVKVYFWRPPNGNGGAYLDEAILNKTPYIVNQDFEQKHLAWNLWNDVSLDSITPAAGKYSLMLKGNASANQWIATEPNTTYTLSFKAKIENPSIPVALGLQKPNGSNYAVQQITDTVYTEHMLNFTTDAGTTKTKIFFFRPPAGLGNASLDQLKISEAPPLLMLNENMMTAETTSIAWPNPVDKALNILVNDFAGTITTSFYDLQRNYVMGTSHTKGLEAFLTISVADVLPGFYILVVRDQSGKTKATRLQIK